MRRLFTYSLRTAIFREPEVSLLARSANRFIAVLQRTNGADFALPSLPTFRPWSVLFLFFFLFFFLPLREAGFVFAARREGRSDKTKRGANFSRCRHAMCYAFHVTFFFLPLCS